MGYLQKDRFHHCIEDQIVAGNVSKLLIILPKTNLAKGFPVSSEIRLRKEVSCKASAEWMRR
jgi:hypothetical protein